MKYVVNLLNLSELNLSLLNIEHIRSVQMADTIRELLKMKFINEIFVNKALGVLFGGW